MVFENTADSTETVRKVAETLTQQLSGASRQVNHGWSTNCSVDANLITGKLNPIQTYLHYYEPDIIAVSQTRDRNISIVNEFLGNYFTLWC